MFLFSVENCIWSEKLVVGVVTSHRRSFPELEIGSDVLSLFSCCDKFEESICLLPSGAPGVKNEVSFGNLSIVSFW